MNILIVDDEIVAVNALKKRIDWNGYGIQKVLAANSMTQAQKIFAEEEIHMMLCDIEMPKGSGLDLFEWVKVHYPHTECIFVTCHPDFEYIRRALQLGSLDYVLKPVDYDELNMIVTAAIERLKAQRAGQEAKRTPYTELADKIAASQNEDNENCVEYAVQFINEHLTEPLCVDDIASHVHLNAQYFMRLFKKQKGVSILEYITNQRVALARQLLVQSDISVSKVSAGVGYGNYSYFIKLFKRETGSTPAEYRNAHKN